MNVQHCMSTYINGLLPLQSSQSHTLLAEDEVFIAGEDEVGVGVGRKVRVGEGGEGGDGE